MSGFGCCFWWFLFGALLGWLASWLLGRMFAKETAVAPAVAPTPLRSSDGIDYAAARAAGYVISGPDNLEIIEGIGPVIANLMRSNGIGTFAKLAGTALPALQAILDKQLAQQPATATAGGGSPGGRLPFEPKTKK